MKFLDRVLQRWRIGKAIPWVRPGDRLLDVGCYHPALLRRVEGRIEHAVGVDPLAEPLRAGRLEVVRDQFPGRTRFEAASFDCLTMLAVLEHVADPEGLARECARVLVPGGRLILTVPRPSVDRILAVLMFLRLVDGMSVEQHTGFRVARTAPIFEAAGLRLVARRPFQLGLNCLFVFEKPGVGVAARCGRPADAQALVA